MMKKHNLRFGLLSSLLALLLIGGCLLITGTLVIDLWIEKSEIHGTSDFNSFKVDMSRDGTWNEHRNDMKSIDNVGFRLWITNTGGEDITGELYASTDSTLTDTTEVRDNATLIFGGASFPPGSSYIDWPTSLKYVHNLPAIRTFLTGGVFTVYGLTTTAPFNMVIDSAEVIVTVTVGS
ncbi:hypothetical protein TRIP_C20935 [Candidatus Zixiibacteriota bacterium]|nr:hypothetical protein TRIP_C20935 [candidate division Zixibacteria bacterium]